MEPELITGLSRVLSLQVKLLKKLASLLMSERSSTVCFPPFVFILFAASHVPHCNALFIGWIKGRGDAKRWGHEYLKSQESLLRGSIRSKVQPCVGLDKNAPAAPTPPPPFFCCFPLLHSASCTKQTGQMDRTPFTSLPRIRGDTESMRKQDILYCPPAIVALGK